MTQATTTSRIQATIQLGVEFWNDSCDRRELADAVACGALGATSNPVIVAQAVQADPSRWLPEIDRLAAERPHATEDEIAWALVETLGRDAAALLAPVHARTHGSQGHLCIQVDPRLYRDPTRMVEHARRLVDLAPNIAIKIPATASGLVALEELTAAGIRTNATVCFTVSQAVACALAVERGVQRAQADGRDVSTLRPVTTIMVGRVDDHLKRELDRVPVTIDPGFLHWAGVAVFKKAHALFVQRGYQSTLLAAAYRHHLHWSELIGRDVVLSIPYKWWKLFDASDLVPQPSLQRAVAPEIVAALTAHFPDFRLAHDEGALTPPAFERYSPSIHTLQQFMGGYGQLLDIVRSRLLR